MPTLTVRQLYNRINGIIEPEPSPEPSPESLRKAGMDTLDKLTTCSVGFLTIEEVDAICTWKMTGAESNRAISRYEWLRELVKQLEYEVYDEVGRRLPTLEELRKRIFVKLGPYVWPTEPIYSDGIPF